MRLGRVVNHDPRSRNFPAAQSDVLITVTHTHYGGSLDQGDLGSCTGNALAHVRNTVPVRKGRYLLHEPAAIKFYSRATELDPYWGHYPPDDTGSSGLAACKAGKEIGAISGYTHAFGIDQALHALVLSPIMVGVNWYEGMFTPAERGYCWPTGKVVGGHEFAITKINVESEYVKCVNSWGNDWGLSGRFLLSWDTLERLLDEEGDAIMPIG